jgi:hypothetical protein
MYRRGRKGRKFFFERVDMTMRRSVLADVIRRVSGQPWDEVPDRDDLQTVGNGRDPRHETRFGLPSGYVKEPRRSGEFDSFAWVAILYNISATPRVG